MKKYYKINEPSDFKSNMLKWIETVGDDAGYLDKSGPAEIETICR